MHPVHGDGGGFRVNYPTLLVLLSVAVLVMVVPPTVHGAPPATELITITPDNGYSSTDSATVTGTGCTVAAIPMDGSQHSFTCNAGTLLTITVPSDASLSCNPNCRYRAALGTTILTYTTDNAPPYTDTNSVKVYFQLQNTYQASTNGQGPPAWDPTLTIIPSGTVLGVSSANVCSITPAGGTTNTATCPGWSDYGRAVTAPDVALGSGPNIQWKLSGTNSYTPTSGGNSVPAFAYYKQLQNTYEVIPNAAPTFDPGLEWIITGTSLGTGSSTICTIFSSAPPTSCTWWSDYDTKVSFPAQAQSSPGFTRWSTGAVVSYTPTTPANTYKVNYYKQVSEMFSFSTSDGSLGYSAPSLLCTQYGSVVPCATLGTSPTQCWLDFGSRWTATSPLLGSTSTHRWSSRNATGIAAAAAAPDVGYYHQFLVTLSYSVIGGGFPSPLPSVSYNAYGRVAVATLNQTASPVWMDSAQSFSLRVPQGNGAERWRSFVSSFAVVENGVYPIALYHQYSLILSYSINGGGGGSVPPTLTFGNFSRLATVSLTQTPVSYWANAGDNWNATTTLFGSGAMERWQTDQTDSGKASSSINEQLVYYHQFYDAFAYSVVGGGSGYGVPTITFMQFGKAVNGTQGWADSGSTYSFTEPLPGSTSSERWDSGGGIGTVTSPTILNETYYHQYAFLLSFTAVSPTVVLGSPLLNFVALGRPTSQPIMSSPAVTWLDTGSEWSVVPAFSGSSDTERWATQQATSGNANSSQTYSFTFYDQFYITISYSVIGGGSPGVPSVSYAAYSNRASAQVVNNSLNIWVNAGSRWTLPPLLPGSTQQERWIVKGPNTAMVLAASAYQATYDHQFFLETTSNSGLGGIFQNQTQWADNGAGFNLNASALPGWKFVYWEGTGSGAYNGTAATMTLTLAGPAREVAVFYPSLSIIVSGGGHVVYSAPGVNGNASSGHTVVYVPLGSNVTLKAVPTIFDIVFEGWSEAAKGKAPQVTFVVNSPTSVSASFGLDYSDIEVIGATIPIVMVLAVYVFVVRRFGRKRS